ncbi:MAG: transporter [Mizugakiibacter sp.]|uniref:transporter n=1 Tax=Mizugakiibacter sp. TaxID=1972610 RepID=UPI0031C34213|nr:transporter [Xanthomonadaceae bacterium]
MTQRHLRGLLAIGLLAFAASAAHAADDGKFVASAGVDYTTGKYGTDTSTDIWDVPLGFGYATGPWSFKLTVPYISISGANNVIPGVGRVENTNPQGRGRGRGGMPTPPSAVTTGSASGLGDVVAQATYQLYSDDAAQFGVVVTGKVKFGTADENKGLGTGKNDYGLNVDLYKGFGAWTVFGGAGYTNYGSSDFIPLHNGWNANLGAGYKLSEADSVGAYYYYREKISDAGFQQSEATAYWNHRIGEAWRVQAYVLAGFADGSPDWGGGATVKYSF